MTTVADGAPDGPTRSVQSHTFDTSRRLERHAGLIREAWSKAAGWASSLLLIDDIDVIIIDAPDQTIPEWGVGGYTYSPNVILVALDADYPMTEDSLQRTFLHEFHHAMRWRGPGCGGSLAQMLVSEGLAQLFEEEVLGTPPFFASTSVTDEEIAEAQTALYDESFSQSKWFFGADGITRSFGYSYGYELCKRYSHSNGKKASQLVYTPTRDILEATSQGGVRR